MSAAERAVVSEKKEEEEVRANVRQTPKGLVNEQAVAVATAVCIETGQGRGLKQRAIAPFLPVLATPSVSIVVRRPIPDCPVGVGRLLCQRD